MKRLIVPLLITILAGTAGKAAAAPYDATITKAQALDIAEAVFRHQFARNVATQEPKTPAYFLGLFGKDPSPEFLSRFKNHKPPVKKQAEFVMGSGLKFFVDRIKRVSKTKVEVSGGYFEGLMSASRNTFTVELKNGKWIVTRDKLEQIS
jgi:hypothetical protein